MVTYVYHWASILLGFMARQSIELTLESFRLFNVRHLYILYLMAKITRGDMNMQSGTIAWNFWLRIVNETRRRMSLSGILIGVK